MCQLLASNTGMDVDHSIFGVFMNHSPPWMGEIYVGNIPQRKFSKATLCQDRLHVLATLQ